MSVLKKIIDHKMIGIIRGYDTEEAVKIVDILIQNKFHVIEVALNSPRAKNTLKVLKEKYGESILLGAGTVLTKEDAQDCINMNLDFLLSPVYSDEILQFSKENKILYIPGCYTPNEIYHAYISGAEMIKVFPAGKLGANFIKDILAPMKNLVLLPTGGVTTENMNEFLKAGSKAIGISSALIPSPNSEGEFVSEDLIDRVQQFTNNLKRY